MAGNLAVSVNPFNHLISALDADISSYQIACDRPPHLRLSGRRSYLTIGIGPAKQDFSEMAKQSPNFIQQPYSALPIRLLSVPKGTARRSLHGSIRLGPRNSRIEGDEDDWSGMRWAKLNGMLEITSYLIALCKNQKKFGRALLIIKMRVKKVVKL